MLAVTIDAEDWYHVPAVTGSPFARFRNVNEFFARWQGRYDYLSGSAADVLTMLERRNIRATFFIVADVAEHYPGLIEKIASKGHEIACHGLHHACKIDPKTKLPLLSCDEFEEKTNKARTTLQKISNQEVIGYRAPGAYIGGWMIDSLEKLGFRYDSSVCVNSFYNKSDSNLNAVSTAPYYPRKGGLQPGDRRNILELPWPYLNCLFKFPTAGGPMLRFFGAGYILSGLKQSIKRGDTLFYFHPIDIAPEKFPINNSWRRPFYWTAKGQTTRERIENILAHLNPADIATCRTITAKYLALREP